MSDDKKILEEEKRILAEERKILQEEKGLLRKMNRDVLIMLVLSAVILVAFGGMAYWRYASGHLYVDKAEISAPRIDLAPQTSGVLEEVFVQQGDAIKANTPVARVGNELVKAKTDGLVIGMRNDVGKLFNRGEAVASMIDPAELRVVVRIEEDKGLKDIRVGQLATFEVDAFDSKKYVGTVDEISPTSRDTSAVFTISDKRAMKDFDVKIRFNPDAYPELKNGMSAKVWISKD